MSENYQNLMERFIEKEVKLRDAKRSREARNQTENTPEVSLDDHSQEHSGLLDSASNRQEDGEE